MPTYEYRCPQGHEFEKFQRMSDDPVAPCPECGKDAERLLSGGGGFLFKGEGFYITDYRSDSYRKAQKAEREAANGKKSAGDKKGAGDGTGTTSGSEKGGSSSTGSGSDTGSASTKGD